MPERRPARSRTASPWLPWVAHDSACPNLCLAGKFADLQAHSWSQAYRSSSPHPPPLFEGGILSVCQTTRETYAETPGYLEQICQASDELKRVYDLSQQFISMVKQREAKQLDAWLRDVREQGPRELRDFAAGIRRDYAAVRAGLSRPESNGQVEGQITRLKYLKRQMYGRAKFDLLRLRVLHAA
jgi:Transposase